MCSIYSVRRYLSSAAAETPPASDCGSDVGSELMEVENLMRTISSMAIRSARAKAKAHADADKGLGKDFSKGTGKGKRQTTLARSYLLRWQRPRQRSLWPMLRNLLAIIPARDKSAKHFMLAVVGVPEFHCSITNR